MITNFVFENAGLSLIIFIAFNKTSIPFTLSNRPKNKTKDSLMLYCFLKLNLFKFMFSKLTPFLTITILESSQKSKKIRFSYSFATLIFVALLIMNRIIGICIL